MAVSRKPYLDAAAHDLVSKAVAQAETTTSGEIVTVLAERSDGYSDIALAWAVLAAFTVLTIFCVFPQFFLDKADFLRGGWGEEWTITSILSLATGLALVKFLAVWLFQLWEPAKFAMIPPTVKTARVHQRAVTHFKVGAERRTHGRTGVMIYLSMSEHRAEIVADAPIAQLVSAEVWGEAMADMLAEIKQGKIAEGMAAGVRDVGIILSQHFPPDENDVNELPDRLIEV
ncbi:hypothetical protein GRI44_07675 [Altererythrobacter confluentis]|uniref:TPM domain-containing protein n=1 Tax=Allopontixanthobacter confluentis TaxID=1849021 RepID=A0A6L7GFG6_9SPHN|nr:hypothetical protein [Allopontixanthobacter confluentis]MXP14627.1 hypothetical protein [Allopontixanthobacter confluentis]